MTNANVLTKDSIPCQSPSGMVHKSKILNISLRENLVYLQIGYKSLSYEEYKQQPEYEIGALFGK